MIIKNMDEYAADLATIERLLLSDPPQVVSIALQRDKSAILNALQHKRDAAYHLDFYFSESSDWAIFHDLHLEMGDAKATFDHLLINREMDIYVIETKHYNARVRINEKKDFFYYVGNRPISVVSPAERNQQHIDFLDSYLAGNGLLPTRFGLSIRPNFHNIVMVSPTASVQLPKRKIDLQCDVVRSDHFLEQICKKSFNNSGVHDFVALARQFSSEALRDMAEKLAQRHIPRNINFSQRYGLESVPPSHEKMSDGGEVCASCSKRITARVVRYCYDNYDLFAGKAYCFDCQKGIAFQAVM